MYRTRAVSTRWKKRWDCACTASSMLSGWNGRRIENACAFSWMFAGSRKRGGGRGFRISLARVWEPSNSKRLPEPSIHVSARRACIVPRKRRKANTAGGNSAWRNSASNYSAATKHARTRYFFSGIVKFTGGLMLYVFAKFVWLREKLKRPRE